MSNEALRSVINDGEVAGRTAAPAVVYKAVPKHAPRLQSMLDPTIARLAVELSLPENHSSEKAIESLLKALCELALLDCVFVTLFDQKQSRIETVTATVSMKLKNCNPQTLLGAMQPCSSEMLKRLGNHQLVDVRDYNTLGPEHELFSSQVASLNLSSALVGGIQMRNRIQGLMFFGSLRRRSSWDVDMHLLMKLMSASYAAGHERLQLQSNAA